MSIRTRLTLVVFLLALWSVWLTIQSLVLHSRPCDAASDQQSTLLITKNSGNSGALKNSSRESRPRLNIGVCQDIILVAIPLADFLATETFKDFDVKIYNVTDKGYSQPGDPDMHLLVCLGYFYSTNLTDLRLLQTSRQVTSRDVIPNVEWTDGSVVRDFTTGPRRPFLLASSSEVWDQGHCRFDVMFTTSMVYSKFNGCPLILWPSGSRSMLARRSHSLQDLIVKPNFDAQKVLSNKLFFAAFLIRTCWNPPHNTEQLIRLVFYHLLSEYKLVFAMGKCKPNVTKHEVVTNSSYIVRGSNVDGATHILKDFKFAITFENTRHPGYFSEKPLNAALVNAIPIYWGVPSPQNYTNTKRMVLCEITEDNWNKFRNVPINSQEEADAHVQFGLSLFREDFQPCIQEVIRLDQDDGLYQSRLKQPILPNNKLEGSYFDLSRIGNAVRALMELQKALPR